jgi:hypothetical protein
MKPEGSLSCSQQPATGPYSEPDESSPQSHPISLTSYFNIILPSTPWSSKWFIPSGLPTNNMYEFSHILHTPPISFSFVHPNIWWRVATNYIDPHFVIFSILLLLPLLGPNAPLSTLFSNTTPALRITADIFQIYISTSVNIPERSSSLLLHCVYWQRDATSQTHDSEKTPNQSRPRDHDTGPAPSLQSPLEGRLPLKRLYAAVGTTSPIFRPKRCEQLSQQRATNMSVHFPWINTNETSKISVATTKMAVF